jgi:hypothetical protein
VAHLLVMRGHQQSFPRAMGETLARIKVEAEGRS